MCEWGDTKTMVIDGRTRDIDSCLFGLVKVLNENGFETVACCCGHKNKVGNIAFKDGRFLDIYSNREDWENLSSTNRGLK